VGSGLYNETEENQDAQKARCPEEIEQEVPLKTVLNKEVPTHVFP
jgi:hypothetical protein